MRLPLPTDFSYAHHRARGQTNTAQTRVLSLPPTEVGEGRSYPGHAPRPLARQLQRDRVPRTLLSTHLQGAAVHAKGSLELPPAAAVDRGGDLPLLPLLLGSRAGRMVLIMGFVGDGMGPFSAPKNEPAVQALQAGACVQI